MSPSFRLPARTDQTDGGAPVPQKLPISLGLLGCLLVVVGALLPWCYNPAILGNLTVTLNPAPLQIFAIVLAALGAFMLVLRAGRSDRLRTLFGEQSGLRPLGIGMLVYLLLVLVAIAQGDSAMFAAADPGMWVSIVGAALVALAGFMLHVSSDRDITQPYHRFHPIVEIGFIAVLLAVALFAAAHALSLQEWELGLFIAFCGALAAGLAGGGFFDWLAVVAAHHRMVVMIGALVTAMLFPLTQNGSEGNMSIATNVLIFAATAMGLNIVVGLAGLLDLGYIAFLGAGAYVGAALSGSAFATIGWAPPFFVTAIVGACFSALLGLIIGSPTLRVSGDYLAIVTLAFGEIFRLTMFNLDGTNGPDLTHGPNGIPNIPDLKILGFDFGQTHDFFGMPITRMSNYYLLLLLLMAFIILVFSNLNNSRIGRGWVAIREDEKAAEAMGVNVFGLKLLAFAGGAFLAGLAGTVKAHQSVSVTPDQYQFLESAFLLAAVVLGGMGTVGGVILGAVVLKLLPEKMRFFNDYRLLLFGLLLVLMMRFRPEGLVANKRRQLEFHEEDVELAEEIEHIHTEKVS